MNRAVFDFFYSLAHRNSLLDWFWVFLAEHLPILIAILFIYLLLKETSYRKRMYFAILAVLSIIISFGLVSPIFRYFYENPRPFMVLDLIPLIDEAPSNSLPSNHMMIFFPLALAIYYLNKRIGWYAIGGIALMGIARIISGVHWPMDILAGLILATASFYLAKYLFDIGKIKQQ